MLVAFVVRHRVSRHHLPLCIGRWWPTFKEVVAVIVAFIGCALLGFAAGLFSFKVKSRWCRRHGIVKSCPLCVGRVVVH